MFGSTSTFGAGQGGAPAAGTAPSFQFGANTSAPASTGGFGFGTAPAPAASTGFSFGGNTTTQPPASTGFNFGGNTATQPPASSSGFSFGGNTTTQPAAAASSGFSFGGFGTASTAAAPTTSTATPSGFSFGGNTGSSGAFGFGGAGKPPLSGQKGGTAGTNTTSMFGANNSGLGFGNGCFSPRPAATSTFSSFGLNTQNTAGGSSFNTLGQNTSFGQSPSTGNTLGFGTLQAPPSNPFAAGAAAGNLPLESLNAIKMAYEDPQQSRFKHMFYNAVDPSQKHLYVRPAHISERLWIQAQRDNPDPSNCVPAAVIGFKELTARVKVQQEHAQKFTGFAQESTNALILLDIRLIIFSYYFRIWRNK